MLKNLVKLLLIIAIVLLPSISRAKDIPPGRWWKVPHFSEQLNLTQQEKEELDKLFDYSRDRLAELKKQLEREKRELTTMLEQKDFSETVAVTHMKKLENTRTLLAATRFSYSLEVRRLLGNDRFQKLKLLYRNWHAGD